MCDSLSASDVNLERKKERRKRKKFNLSWLEVMTKSKLQLLSDKPWLVWSDLNDVLPTHILILSAHLLSCTLSSPRPHYPCALQSGPGPTAIDTVINWSLSMTGVSELWNGQGHSLSCDSDQRTLRGTHKPANLSRCMLGHCPPLNDLEYLTRWVSDLASPSQMQYKVWYENIGPGWISVLGSLGGPSFPSFMYFDTCSIQISTLSDWHETNWWPFPKPRQLHGCIRIDFEIPPIQHYWQYSQVSWYPLQFPVSSDHRLVLSWLRAALISWS